VRDTTDTDAALGRAAFGTGRVSAQRLAIARAADASTHCAFSVDELAGRVRAETPGIGVATVYRAVAAMEAAGFIEPLGTRDGATLYARCRHGGHHHHMLCTGCGAVADVECPVTVSVAGAPAGFEVTGHRLVLYGTCADCRDRAGTS
jgi:Fur family ferric uptake transcriptional regulator